MQTVECSGAGKTLQHAGIDFRAASFAEIEKTGEFAVGFATVDDRPGGGFADPFDRAESEADRAVVAGKPDGAGIAMSRQARMRKASLSAFSISPVSTAAMNSTG